MRRPLHGGVSLLALLGAAAPVGVAWGQCTPTSRSLSGTYGTVYGDGGSIAITNTGVITGIDNGNGIDLSACGATSINNAGNVSGPHNGVYGFVYSVDTLVNSGHISGTGAAANGFYNGFGSVTVLTNASTGVISGTQTGVQNYGGSFTTLTNSGSISGNGVGIQNKASTIDTLTNSGSIVATGVTGTALYNAYSTISTVTNTGTIAGGAFGVQNIDASIGILTNGGSISGTVTGISNAGPAPGTIGSLANSGTISGPTAIYSKAGMGPITNSGLISGNVHIQNQDVAISGGTGATFGTLANGLISIDNGNLLFAGGNQQLDDDISVNGGTGTVINQGVLRLVTSHAITGNMQETATGELALDFAGTGAGQFGRLAISAALTLVGGLAVDLTDGFTLSVGDDFDILDFASLTGDFDSFSLDGISCSSGASDIWTCANLGGGLYIAEVKTDNDLDLVVRAQGSGQGVPTPEPGSLGLLGGALAGLAALRRKRDRSG